MCFGLGRGPAPSFTVILKILFRLRKAQTEYPVPGIISAAGVILPAIVIHNL